MYENIIAFSAALITLALPASWNHPPRPKTYPHTKTLVEIPQLSPLSKRIWDGNAFATAGQFAVLLDDSSVC